MLSNQQHNYFMNKYLSKEDINEVLEELTMLRERLSDKYLDKHCRLVTEELDGYDGCYRAKRVYTEEDQQKASKEAKETIAEAIKILQ